MHLRINSLLEHTRPAASKLAVRRLNFPWMWQLVALFAAAWAWRLNYLYRLNHSPLASSLLADEKTYWEWAGFLLKNGPLGHNPFFMGPLYPYVLALLRLAAGDSIPRVLILQSLWGTAAVVLLADAARRMTRPAIGLFIGFLAAGYQMAVFFDGLVLMESLLFSLECLLLWLVARESRAAARPLALAGMGFIIGLLAQGRATSIVLLVPLALLARRGSSTIRETARRISVALATFLVVCLPTAIRNQAVSREWILFTYNFGLNLYIGNNPAATGSYVDITAGTYATVGSSSPIEDGGTEGDGRDYLAVTEKQHLTPAASSRYWAQRAIAYDWANPGRTLRLTLRKLAMLWNQREYPQLESHYEFRAILGPIGLPLAGTFALLGTLAIAGSMLAWKAPGAGRFIVGYVIAMSVVVLPFFVVDRYRHHLIPAAALLAAFALEEAYRLAGKPDTSRLLVLLGWLAVGVTVVNLPTPSRGSSRVAWETASDLGDRWLTKGRPDLALPEYEKAIAIESKLGLLGSETSAGRIARAGLSANYGVTLLLAGRDRESILASEDALRLAPGAPQIVFALGQAKAVQGHLDEARARCAEAGADPKDMALDLTKKAFVASDIGRLDVAERLLLAATALDSTAAWPHRILIRAYVTQGRLAEAGAVLSRAQAAGFTGAPLHLYEAMLAAAAGDLPGAHHALSLIDESSLQSDPSLSEDLAHTRRLIAAAAKTHPPN